MERRQEDRISMIEATLKNISPKVETIDVIANDITWIKKYLEKNGFASNAELQALKKTVDTHLVRKEEFETVKKVVYGGVTLILSAVVLAVVGLVLIK